MTNTNYIIYFAGPFASGLTMSVDLWYSVAKNWPELMIRMLPLPNNTGRVVLTTALQGYTSLVDGSTSTVCAPPAMCDGKPTPSVYGTYCIAKPNADHGQLGGAVGYACGELAQHGFDCAKDVPAACNGDDLFLKANYIFSTYLEKKLGDCNFGGVAFLSNPNQPTPKCVNTNETLAMSAHWPPVLPVFD